MPLFAFFFDTLAAAFRRLHIFAMFTACRHAAFGYCYADVIIFHFLCFAISTMPPLAATPGYVFRFRQHAYFIIVCLYATACFALFRHAFAAYAIAFDYFFDMLSLSLLFSWPRLILPLCQLFRLLLLMFRRCFHMIAIR